MVDLISFRIIYFLPYPTNIEVTGFFENLIRRLYWSGKSLTMTLSSYILGHDLELSSLPVPMYLTYFSPVLLFIWKPVICFVVSYRNQSFVSLCNIWNVTLGWNGLISERPGNVYINESFNFQILDIMRSLTTVNVLVPGKISKSDPKTSSNSVFGDLFCNFEQDFAENDVV